MIICEMGQRFILSIMLITLALFVSITAFPLTGCFASANSLFNEGYQLMQQSVYDQAAAKFQEALTQDPRHLSSMSSLGMCLEKLRRYDEAIEVWRRYDQIKPAGRPIYEHIALLGQMKNISGYLDKKDIAPAMTVLKQVLKDSFRDSVIALDASTILAHWYYSQNKFPEAYSIYSQVLGKYPIYLVDDTGVYDYAKLLSSQQNNNLESAKYLKELSARPNLSLSREEVINQLAESYKCEAEKIEKSPDKDKDKKARLLYEKIALECPTSKQADLAKGKVGDIAKSLTELKGKADECYKSGDYLQALDLYQRLSKSSEDPNIIQYAMFQTGQCVSTKRDFTGAIKIFHEAVKQYPEGESSDDCLVRAACLLGGLMEKPELAIKEWGILLQRYPNSPYADIAYFDTGRLYKENLNNHKKAAYFFKKVITAYPSSAWVELAKYKLNEMKNAAK